MVEIKHTTDDRMAEAVETLAAALDRFSEAFDRLTYVVEDLGTRLGLGTLDEVLEEK